MLPWNPSASFGAPGHALWVPRAYQGSGRHDAPDSYGCLYLAETPVATVAELLAPFRGTGDLQADLLVRSGRQLAAAELELANDAELIDLDEPAVLLGESLRPSVVATNQRSITQAYALAAFDRHPTAAGLRWWSALEASWIQITLFDRAVSELRVHRVRALSVDDAIVIDAATYLGLA